MLGRLRLLLYDAWPFAGAAYLLYLAFRPPPVRYVGIGGLVVVTPLLVGWTVGHLFDVGPWADGTTDGSGMADESETTGENRISDDPTADEPAGSDDREDESVD